MIVRSTQTKLPRFSPIGNACEALLVFVKPAGVEKHTVNFRRKNRFGQELRQIIDEMSASLCCDPR
jgi:hypothetical protein